MQVNRQKMGIWSKTANMRKTKIVVFKLSAGTFRSLSFHLQMLNEREYFTRHMRAQATRILFEKKTYIITSSAIYKVQCE